MKKIISGVLRLIVALIYTWYSYITLVQLNLFKKFPSDTIGHKLGLIVILLININFVLYMVVNAVNDFKNKPIALKPMYIIFFLTTLIVVIAIFPIGDITTNRLILIIIYALIIAYFIINDLIGLWFKKRLPRSRSQ